MSHKIPANLLYTKEHEWVEAKGDIAILGITDFAQSSMGDIVFIEAPDVGTDVSRNAACGVVESIKSVSDIFSPVSGKVVEANTEVASSPELVNSDPYAAWIIKIKLSNPKELGELMNAAQYAEHCNA
jgi:glycine cleavage system H protein